MVTNATNRAPLRHADPRHHAKWSRATSTWPLTVEGHVNRIKMIKRQMYGRARPDLLRKRVLLGD
jgi:transposase